MTIKDDYFESTRIGKLLKTIACPEEVYTEINRLWLDQATTNLRYVTLKCAVTNTIKELKSLIESEELNERDE